MANPINYAEDYQQALQQPFKVGLRFLDCYNTPNNKLIRWVNAKTIQVPNIATGGYVDVNRDAVTGFTRRVDNSYIPYTLEHDREFSTLVDPTDIDETNMALTIANITQVFNTEHKIPEMDKYMASKLYSEVQSKGGTIDTTALTVDNVLNVFDSLMQAEGDAEVPIEDRILYVTPAINTLLKSASQIQRRIDVSATDGSVNRSVRSLDEVNIVIVPSSRMKTLYNFTDDAVADGTAKQINMILCNCQAMFSPLKYEFVSLDEPSAKTGGKWLYYERAYWDVFLIQQKVPGVMINAAA